jgi:hypothetical protein
MTINVLNTPAIVIAIRITEIKSGSISGLLFIILANYTFSLPLRRQSLKQGKETFITDL